MSDAVAIAQAAGVERIKATGQAVISSGLTGGCPSLPYNAPFNPADSLDKLNEAAKALGMDEKCQTHAAAISDQTTSEDKTTMVAVSPFVIGGGQTSSSSTSTYTDNSMSSSGCGNISVTANAINNEQISMTCNMNSTLSESSTTVQSGSSLAINLMPAEGEALTAITTISNGLRDNITKAQKEVTDNASGPVQEISEITVAIARSANPSAEFLKIAVDALKSIHAQKVAVLEKVMELNKQTLDNFNYNNPIQSGVFSSTINQTITSSVKVSQTQNIEAEHKTKMTESISRMAKAVAMDQVTTALGPGAVGDGERTMINDSVNNAITSSQKNIDETVTKNSMKVGTDNSITLNVNGPVRDSEINQALSSQVSLAVMQSVKKSVEIGSTVATKIITDTLTDKVKTTTKGGLDAVVAAAGEANAGLIEATKAEGLGAAFEGLGTGLGNVAEGVGTGIGTAAEGIGKGVGAMMGAAMIPLIIVGVLVIGGLFLFPKLIPKLAAMSGASPGMIKIGGMILFALIIAAVVWFFVMPHFKSEKRRRNNIVIPAPRQATPPVKTQPMKSPYQKRVQGRYFKGERTARKIPSYKKINQSNNFRPPTEKTHTNVYNPTQLSLNTTTVHNPTYHYQNKVEDKPVAYTKKSRV